MELTNSKTWKKNSTGISRQIRTPKSDNYYNGIVSKELKDSSNVAEVLLGVIRRESVTNQSDFVNEGIQSIFDRFGIKTDKPLTRKEKLLAFIGFKAGLMWGEIDANPEPVRTSFTQPSRNCHDGTSQNKRKKMLILS